MKINIQNGFSLIELLVVVVIIGVLSAIGIVSYSGYIESTHKNTALNTMGMIAMSQEEYRSGTGYYYYTSASCGSENASKEISKNLLNANQDVLEQNYNFCITGSKTNFTYSIQARNKSGSCNLFRDTNGKITESNC